MQVPNARGDLSAMVFDALRAAPHPLPEFGDLPNPRSEDFQVTLWVLQELGFRPLASVHRSWENEPTLAGLRRRLEFAQESELRSELFYPTGDDAIATIEALATGGDDASLSAWMEQHGDLDHMREFVLHRSAYQLKEADPHSFAIPRLPAGRAKSALLKIQLDEYGDAELGESHQELFNATMGTLGVEFDLDEIPAVTLRTNTVLNALTTQRRLLGALLGHLALFELTSVTPMARYAAVLRRVLPVDTASAAARFFDAHVAADAFHGRIAIDEMISGFLEVYPDEADEVVFGAATVTAVEGEFSRHLMRAWEAESSSLRGRASTKAAA